MAFALVAGLVLGAAGALFRRGSQWAEKSKPSGAGILWMLPLAGLLTGVVAIWVPQVMGNGRATAQLSFSSKADLAVVPILLVSFLAKAIVTLLTIHSGASGGVLQPGIALGASGVLCWVFCGCRCFTRIRLACTRCWVRAHCSQLPNRLRLWRFAW